MFECKTFLKDQRSCTRKQACRHLTLGSKVVGKKYKDLQKIKQLVKRTVRKRNE